MFKKNKKQKKIEDGENNQENCTTKKSKIELKQYITAEEESNRF